MQATTAAATLPQTATAHADPIVSFTLFSDPLAQDMKAREAKWSQLAPRFQDPPVFATKAACKLIKLAAFGDKRTKHGSLRSDENLVGIYGVEADYDAGEVGVHEAAARLRAAGIEAVICTTASHTPEKPRWRIFAPLSRAHQPAERRHFVGILNRTLGGVLAPESFTASQAFYLGRVEGRPFDAVHVQGAPLDHLPHPPDPLFPTPASPAARTANDEADALLQVERDSALARVDSGTFDDLRSALNAIPADDRHVWVSMGQALASLKGTEWEDDARACWVDWSATSAKHNPHADPDQWQTFQGTRSDYRAVFAEAGRHGWKNSSQSTKRAGPRGSTHSTRAGVVLTPATMLEPKPISWLWNGWIARGKVGILAGSPGQGKTTLALMFAATVSQGGTWPDGTTCRVGNVLIWSGEDDPADTLVPRLHAMGCDPHRIHFIGGRRVDDDGEVVPFDPAEDMPALLRAATELGDVALIVLDPVVSVVAGDSHKNTEVRRAMQPVVDLAGTLGAAVLGISHFSKGTGGRDPAERVTGSIAFAAVARVVLVASKMQSAAGNDERRVLARAKSNISADTGGFIYSIKHIDLSNYAGISASRVVWGEAIDATARELLAEAESATSDNTRERSRGEALMRELLANGAVLGSDVQHAMKAEGYSAKEIRRIRERLGVETRRQGFGAEMTSLWSLLGSASPRAAASDAQSCQSGPPNGDGTTGHDCDGDAEFGDFEGLPSATD